MFEKLLLQNIIANPAIFGMLVAIIRNIGGYVYNCFEAKKLLPYSASQLLETLALYETLFVALGGLADLPANWYVSITFFLDFIRNLKKAITSNRTTPAPTPTPEPELPSNVKAVKIGDSFSIAQVQELLLAGFTFWKFPDGSTHAILIPKPPCLGQTLTSIGWTAIMPLQWTPIDTHPTNP